MGTLAAAIHATVYRGGVDPSLILDTSLLTGLDARATFSTEATAGEAFNRNCYGRFDDTRGNEARFWGARRVENINGYFINQANARSEPLSGDTANTAASNYTLSATELPIDDSSIPAQRMWRCSAVRTGGSTGYCSLYASVASVSTRSRLHHRGTYIVSAYVKVRSYSLNPSYACYINVALDTRNSSDAGVAYPNKSVCVITGTGTTDLPIGQWKRVFGIFAPAELGGSTVDRTTVGVKLSINNADIGGSVDFDVTGIQFEEVSGNTWQGPSEYVRNVGVAEPSTKVPGVLYFPTTLSGTSSASLLGSGRILESLTTTPISASVLGGLVIERAETNLCQLGNVMNGGAWIPGNATITNNAANSPSGRNDANYLVENTAAAVSHYIAYICSGFAAGEYALLSVYVKATRSRQWVAIAATARDASDAFISDSVRYFNISAKTIGTKAGSLAEVTGWVTASVLEDCADSWVRVAVCVGPLPTNTAKVVLWVQGATADGTNAYTGSGQDEYALWCPSISKQRTVTSPILCSTAADVTRDATTLSFPSSFNTQVDAEGSAEVSNSYPYRSWEQNATIIDFRNVSTTGGVHDGWYGSEHRLFDGTNAATHTGHSAPTNRQIVTRRANWKAAELMRTAAIFNSTLYNGSSSVNFDGSMNCTGVLRIHSQSVGTDDRIGTLGIRRVKLWKKSKGSAWTDAVPAL